jgi:DNA-binding IclR family transcriptional regulator
VLLALGSETAVEQGTLGVTRIAELLGREKSQVSRTLKTLSEFGLVERDPETRGYRLGWRIYALASVAGERLILDIGRPILQQLVSEFGESAYLSVRHGAESITILAESASSRVQSAGWVGRTTPLYCTAVGRALLMDDDEATVRALLANTPLLQLAPQTACSIDIVVERLEEARATGVAIADEEVEAGLISVAVPVRDPQGRVIAAINVAGPKYRFNDHIDRAGVYLQTAADQISTALRGIPR